MRVKTVSENLGQIEQTIEENLIQLRLIEGMYNASHRYKIMEQRHMIKVNPVNLPILTC